MRIVFVALAIMLAVASAVNLNDPDPFQWVTLYGAAAIAAAWQAWKPGRVPLWLPVLTGAAALVWALFWAPHVFGHVGFGEMWASWTMHNDRVEYGREFYGLLVAVVSMALVLWHRSRSRA
jgi:hypothetical protein